MALCEDRLELGVGTTRRSADGQKLQAGRIQTEERGCGNQDPPVAGWIVTRRCQDGRRSRLHQNLARTSRLFARCDCRTRSGARRKQCLDLCGTADGRQDGARRVEVRTNGARKCESPDEQNNHRARVGRAFHGILMITAAEGTPLKVIWLDAYGNSNTPETTVSGCFDGVALAAANGRCASLLQRTLTGFQRCQSYD